MNTKYGLYLYIYNPSRTEFEEKTSWENNTVNMATSYNADGAPDRYDKLRLKNCGYTTGEYDKLFYKFRIIGLEDVVKNVQAMDEQYGYRRYDISEIELRVKGNTTGAHAYTIARTYTYKGYAEGCGSEEASTLVCEQSEMDVIKDLPVHQTVWRPEGNNGKSEYTQDSLHSVWFSVPNKYIEKYGEMYAVHAMWREAVLKPFLVTGNQEAYNAIEKYLASGIIKGLGPATARKIVNKFGEESIEIIRNLPEKLVEVKGINYEKALTMSQKLNEQWDLWRLTSFLGTYGVGNKNYFT